MHYIFLVWNSRDTDRYSNRLDAVISLAYIHQQTVYQSILFCVLFNVKLLVDQEARIQPPLRIVLAFHDLQTRIVCPEDLDLISVELSGRRFHTTFLKSL